MSRLSTRLSADDTITVKAAPTATGTAPKKAAARLRSGYTAPTAGQMALFVGDVQVSEPVETGADGTYTMTVSAAEVLLQGNAEPNGNAITLTAKFVENDNMADAAGTVDVRISAVAMAEKDNAVIGYYGESNLDAAFEDSGNAGATITLLSDVEPSTYLTIQIDCTLDLGGHTITGPMGRSQCVIVETNTAVTIRGEGEITATNGIALTVNGSVTLEGGTYTSGGSEFPSVHVMGQSAMLSVTGEKVSIRNTSGGCGLIVAQAQSVRLSAGTYSGTAGAISSTVKLSDMLAHMDNIRYAYYQGDTLVTTGLDGQALTGTVTVKVCDHTGDGDGVCEYTPNENDASTHTKTCLACGYAETGNCGFEKTADPTADNHTGQCPYCKRDRSDAHSFSEWSGDPVARVCTVCGYEQTAVAKVEKSNGGGTEYMTAKGLNTVFASKSDYEGATVTLLDDVTITEAADRPRINIRCTLNLNGHTIRSDAVGAPPLEVSGYGNVTITGNGKVVSNSNIALLVLGTVVLEGGTFSSGVAYSGTVEVMSGNLSVTGENVVMENTGNNGYGLSVNDNAKSVQLSAGTYSGAARAISVSGSFTLDDLLNQKGTSRVAYYKDNATLVTEGLDGQTLPSGSYTVRVCTHAYRYTHTTGATTHSQTCPACGDAKAAETCSYDAATGRCACGSTLAVTLPADLALTYDSTAKTPAVTVTVDGTELAAEKYQINYDNNINAGNTAKVTVTAANGSFSGSASTTFSIGKAGLTIMASDQTITYGGSIAQGPGQVTPTGLCTGDTLESVTLTPSTRDVPGGNIIASEARILNDSGEDMTANYNITYQPGTLTINQAQGTLTVPAGPVAKTFGDGQFLLGCSTNGDGKMSYASSDENVASVSADGNVLIKGAGEAVITVSLADGTNYTGAESQEVRITVAKAAAPAIPGETRNYTYLNGSHGAVTIDVAGKFPKDRGETTYTAATTDGKGILSGVSIDQDGNLVYTVEANKAAGDTAVITVTAVMANYGDTAYAVTIELVEKKTVEPQDGGSVSVKDGCILTYGQTLSDLTLETVIFVEQGTEKQVEGTLAWSNPSHVPEVADRTAQWVFTPKDNREYEQLTGTAAITVVKATPETEAPEAAAVTYHPAGTLGSVGLNGGGAAWTVGGSAVTVEGTWGWKEPSAIPAVKNSGYTAVFTPEDTANYDMVERTVAVTVAKAEPYIETPPTAAQITYGDALDASALTGGTVQYSSSDGTAVTGSFAWKDGSIKPDSGSAAYTVVFTPADSTDYSSVETQVTLVTGKAENAPDMPPSAMDVARRFEKVGDVGLPEGWQWQDTDRDKALEIGVPVTATAVYTGADRDNYRNVTVSVAITRADCDHEHTETRNAVTATCQRKGYTGDTWCLDCGELLAKGTETDLADHSGGTATCISGKVCQVCGTEYTGKDSANHMHTEIRGAIKAGCTSDGYTGDTYCTDCGAKTGSGRAVPAAGHDWHVTGEEAATTTSEGRRIYTCGECGQTREESIPKLPQPSHTHSYSPRETKAATCRSNGVITYSCSCGDSYTQNTAALGHSYRSEVTKQPTVSAEGVMTYTCGRCGHSYTRPIAKLPDTGTQQPGTEQPGTSQPGDTGPGGNTEETRPDTGIPFIKDEDGKTGWDVIRAEEEQAQEGSTINVDMNGTTVVPGDIFDSIRGRDITVTFDMGNGIIWSVDGKSITGDVSSPDKAGDIDFSVKTGTNAIPVDIVNNVTGERYSIQVSLAHDGEFGFTAVLSIGLGKENAGYTASLYYYNESTRELEFICSDEVAEDGTAELAFTHASDYVIVVGMQGGGFAEAGSGNVSNGTPEGSRGTDAVDKAPQTGQTWGAWLAAALGILAIAAGGYVFLAVKRKKETEE